jgi:DNA-binding PadR family transcriptional regulator
MTAASPRRTVTPRAYGEGRMGSTAPQLAPPRPAMIRADPPLDSDTVPIYRERIARKDSDMDHHDHHDSPTTRGERRFRFQRPADDAEFPPMGPGGSRGHRGHRGGPGPGFGPGFGPGPGFGSDEPDRRRERHGHGPRARGDVRAAILLLLEEQPRHGYELMQEITERSSGSWSPSPGSIYPTLQVLEDEGLLTIETVEGRKTASLTAAGTAYVEENRSRLGEPWASSGNGDAPALALRQEIHALMSAFAQVAKVGTPAQHVAATAALVSARKELYRILADDAEPAG